MPGTVVRAHGLITEFIVSPRDRLEPTIIGHKSEAGYLFGVFPPTSIVNSPL